MDDKRIADYFVVAGLREDQRIPFDEVVSTERISHQKSPQTPSAPITDITVIIRSQGEVVPNGFTCIETTPFGFAADLNHGSLRSPNVYLCFKRGTDKPPLVDIGVLYEGKERVMSDSEVVSTTLYGRSANVNNGGSRTFLTLRRSRDNAPCNQLVVTDICVILANKGESPPHAFCLINKNLNKGMVGSDVFICYKKSMNRPPLLCYKPFILDRFPLEDYPHFLLPESVSLFCFPMGATIECWPKRAQQPKPIFSTFVLTSDSAEKVYGAAIAFYERFSETNLNEDELKHLQYTTDEDRQLKLLHRTESICILSRWPFFDTFERYLLFLHKTLFSSAITSLKIPIERYISHFMLDVPFPSPQRPKILMQLGANAEETVLISQPPEYMPLPLNGASFTQMLRNLGPENCLHVLLFALTEQKILLHSLRPDVLTSVAEAVITMIFPFHWQCPYIPMCPLGLCDVLNAPLPFIVGVDSRYFDYFEPPIDVASVDLDTNSIYLSEHKRHLNPKLLPKKQTKLLKSTLEKIFEKLMIPIATINGASSNKSKISPFHDNNKLNKIERQIEIEIQEAFIRFMASVLRNFRSYLLPITRAPTVGATDPSSLFDIQGFLKSRDKNFHKFYSLLMRTQMFTRFIEERSFVTDKNISLAFFDDCSEKLEAMGDAVDASASIKLLDIDDIQQNDRTVFIPPPEPISADDEYTYHQFGPLNPLLYHRHPTLASLSRIGSLVNDSETGISENSSIISPSSPMSKRTKQEIRVAQKIAKRHSESPLAWTKCLLSYCYSLWFIHLPSYVKVHSLMKGKPLNVAFQVLLRMQSLNFHPPDEVCYRVMMLLCGIYNQPVLAVKVLFEMKQHGVTPNAITYGYYNKAVLESKWPTGETNIDTTGSLMWNKLRNVIMGVALFRKSGRIRALKSNYIVSDTEHLGLSGNNCNTNSERHSSDGGYITNTESTGSAKSLSSTEQHLSIIRTVKFDNSLDFRESDAFREKTRSIVRKSTSSLTCLQDYDSPAGLLMTSQLLNFSFDEFDGENNFIRRRHKSADHERLKMSNSNATVESNQMDANPKPSTKPFLKHSTRSYSFGSDAQIIQKLKHGALKELRQQLKQSSSADNGTNKLLFHKEKEIDFSKRISSNGSSHSSKTIDILSRCNEVPEEEAEEEIVKNWENNINESNLNKINQNCDKSTENIVHSDENCETLQSNQVNVSNNNNNNNNTNNSNDITSTFSPLKDAFMNLEIFSPEGKVASTLRSSFRMASRFAKSTPLTKTGISRSSTFHNSSDKNANRIGSFFRRGSQKNETENGTPMKTISRSATLPPVSPSKLNDETTDNFDNSIKNSESDESINKREEDSLKDKDNSSSVLWANKLAASKHSEYVYSTIKSAANTMASHLSGLKSSLASSSATNSPSKQLSSSGNTSGVANVASGTAALLSQWASLVAEKFPANFVFDDDDCSSNNSFDMRRASFAASEDDLSERSREGSLSRNFTGFNVGSNASFPLYDLLEQYYSTNLESNTNSNESVMEIDITSCSRCYTCYALIYDEEIMEGWSADDSNLNTNCTFCNSKFVPLLTVSIKDLRIRDSNESLNICVKSVDNSDKDVINKQLDPKSIETDKQNSQSILSHDEVDCCVNNAHQTLETVIETKDSQTLESDNKTDGNERRFSKLVINTEILEPFTVPYLSSLVLRKEIENVLNNEGDSCLTKFEFVDDHPIIYWNLVWYFKRVNLPSHLPGLCLYAATFNKNLKISENSKAFDYRNVSVRCMWDNEKLHDDMGSPLHHLWLESALRSPLLHALVTDDHKINRNLLRQIISSIQCNDLLTPMKLLVNERLKVKALKTLYKQHSIYRDLLFLSFVALGRENIDHTAFDREYRRAYESMTPKEQLGLNITDKPPTVGAIFCRRFFKELDLKPQSSSLLTIRTNAKK